MPTDQRRLCSSLARTFACVALPVLLAACGGGNEAADTALAPANCGVPEQKAWLGNYMNE